MKWKKQSFPVIDTGRNDCFFYSPLSPVAKANDPGTSLQGENSRYAAPVIRLLFSVLLSNNASVVAGYFYHAARRMARIALTAYRLRLAPCHTSFCMVDEIMQQQVAA